MKVICTVGTSALPVFIAVDALRADEVALVHGDGLAAHVAERVARKLRADGKVRSIRLIEVPPYNPVGIRAALEAGLPDGAGDHDLLYGPGTAPMGVMTYSWWIASAGHTQSAWYLGARPPVLYSDSGKSVVCEPGNLDIRGIAQLNLECEPPATLVFKPPIRLETAAEVAALAEVARIITTTSAAPACREIRSVLLRSKNSRTPLARQLLASSDAHLIGTALEIIATSIVSRLSIDAKPADEVAQSLIYSVNGVQPTFELDVVARTGNRLLVVSCGAGPQITKLRAKYFEVVKRSEQLGGSEVRSLTVVVASGQRSTPTERVRKQMSDLRERLEARSHGTQQEMSGRHTIVALRELLGDDAHDTLSDPNRALSQDPARAPIAAFLGVRP